MSRGCLARAYHLSGETTNARQLYQQVLRHEKAHAFHQEAKEYLTHLQPVPKPIIREQSKVFAFQMTLGQWLRGQDWNARLKNMMSRGVTTQLINVEMRFEKARGNAAVFRDSYSTADPLRCYAKFYSVYSAGASARDDGISRGQYSVFRIVG